jgi:mannan endo-1,4-beta-mannosidase
MMATPYARALFGETLSGFRAGIAMTSMALACVALGCGAGDALQDPAVGSGGSDGHSSGETSIAGGGGNAGGSSGSGGAQNMGGTSNATGSTDSSTSTTPGSAAPTLHVQGRFLYDKCGEQVVIRGIETDHNGVIGEMAKTQANAIRLVYTMTATDLENALKQATGSQMLVSMIPANGKYMDTSWWNQADIKAVLLKYEPWIFLHAYGEGAYDGSDSARWLSETKKVVSDLRGFGYKFPLEILANQWGQEQSTLLNYGKQIVDFDPEHNVLLGCQMYSIYHPDDATIASVVNSGLPIMLGAASFRDPSNPSQGWYGAPLDQYKIVWQKTFENKIGSFYWDWDSSIDGMTTNGIYGSWTPQGEVIAGTGTYSTPKTAKKTHWMTTGQCAGQ